MPSEIASNATDVKAVVEKKSITGDEFAAQRVFALQAKLPKSEAPAKEAIEAESEAKPKEPKAEAQQSDAKESKEEAKDKEVLSKVNLDELSDEDIVELSQKGKSGLLKRVAELTAKRKVAEERLAQREQELAQLISQKPSPLLQSETEIPKEISALNKPEEIQAKFKQVEEVIEWAERVLDANDHLAASDVAISVDGKDYTKAQVKEYMREARKVKDKYLPAQVRELQTKVQREQVRQTLELQARKELEWFDGEDNDVRKNYQAMMSDPRLAKLTEAAPDLAPQLPYILAHAANSMYGRKALSLEPATKAVKMTPPSAPSASVAQSDRSEDRGERSVKEIAKRLQESGRPDDFIALRTAQISKRKRL